MVVSFVVICKIDANAGILSVPVLTLGLGVYLYRSELWVWIPAIVISGVWMYFGGHMYTGYAKFGLMIGDVSVYPLVMWPTGLVLFYHLFARWMTHESWIRNGLRLAVIYSLMIITAEYVGYNVLNIKLDSGKAYPGWPILDIFHCPWWMCLAYFVNGITFSGVVAYVRGGKKPPEAAAAPA